MILQIYEIIKVNRSLDVLIKQQLLYPINIAYKIYQLKKDLDEIENYVFERFSLIYPNANLLDLKEDESVVYNTLLTSSIEINSNITKEELLICDDINISVEDITNIMLLFNEKSKINS